MSVCPGRCEVRWDAASQVCSFYVWSVCTYVCLSVCLSVFLSVLGDVRLAGMQPQVGYFCVVCAYICLSVLGWYCYVGLSVLGWYCYVGLSVLGWHFMSVWVGGDMIPEF